MTKQPLDIPRFGGINTLHTRSLGQSSFGKNFWTKNGSLVTRGGCSYLPHVLYTVPITSLHTGGVVNAQPKLFAETRKELHVLGDAGFTLLKSSLTGPVLSAVQYNHFMIFGNGNEMFSYNLKDGTVEDLKNITKPAQPEVKNPDGTIKTPASTEQYGTVPSMEQFITYRKYLFGWSPNKQDSNRLWFNGPKTDHTGADLGMSKDVWPPDHFLAIGGSEGSSIIEVIPFNTHLFVLTRKNSWRIYGYSKDNFEVNTGGSVGVHGQGLAQLVGEMIMWVGNDKRIYAYSGADTYPMSQNIDELLSHEDITKAFTFAYGMQFWLVITGEVSRCYVFDILEKEWYIHEFPFPIHSACSYYGADHQIYFGTSEGQVAKMDGSTSDAGAPIETECMVGPFDMESRKFKAKSLWINSEARQDFALSIEPFVDDETRSFSAIDIDVPQGNQSSQRVRLSGVKGTNISLRITSQDRIDELQKLTLAIVVKDVK